MAARVCALFVPLQLLSVLNAQQAAPPQTVREDDVATYLANLREPALRRMNLDALSRSARTSLAAGRFRDAEEAYRTLIAQEPAQIRGLEGVARVYMAENRNGDAVAFLRSAVIQNANREDILFAFVRVAQEVKEFDSAISALTAALDRFTDAGLKSEISSQLGGLYMLKSDFPSSIASFRHAIELRPANRLASVGLARALEASGQEAEATEVYRAALGVDPHDATSLFRRASTLANSGGDLDVAVVCAEMALQLSPNDAAISDLLAGIYLRQGMSQKALAMFEELVMRAPDVWTHHFDLALALIASGDSERAMNELQAALRNNPPEEQRTRIQYLIDAEGARK